VGRRDSVPPGCESKCCPHRRCALSRARPARVERPYANLAGGRPRAPRPQLLAVEQVALLPSYLGLEARVDVIRLSMLHPDPRSRPAARVVDEAHCGWNRRGLRSRMEREPRVTGVPGRPLMRSMPSVGSAL